MFKMIHAMAIGLIILLNLSCGGSGKHSPESSATLDATNRESPPNVASVVEVADGPPSQAVTLVPEQESTLRPPQPLPETSGHVMPEPYPYSLEQQIMLADIVVLATFQSVSPGTETMPAPEGEQPTYRPVLTMTFRATEYLKGTGPKEFAVELRSDGYEEYRFNGQRYRGYLTQAEALAEATRLTTARDTKYDDQPGILFLSGPITPVSPSSASESNGGTGTRSVSEGSSSAATTYGFVLHHREGSFDYSVDTTSRAWLPGQATGSGGTSGTRSSDSADPEFISDGTEDPPPVVSLSAVRTRISEIDAMLRDGAGIEGWETCIYSKLSRSHVLSHLGASGGLTVERTFESGLAKTAILEPSKVGLPGYVVYWTSGPDGDLFHGLVTDNDDDPNNGYHFSYLATRPLPTGSYTVHALMQDYTDVPCNFKPDDRPIIFEVSVVSPTGTLHEAFFDPTESGRDEVSPAGFTVNGTSTEITSLEWSNNKVVLTLDPHISLGSAVLSFIELDGSISLSLSATDATVDSAVGTHSWPVTTEPWEDGDKLMLRIRKLLPEVSLTNMPTSLEQGSAHWFTVELVNLDPTESYSYRLSADNANVAFHNTACSSNPVTTTVTAGATSHSQHS